MSLDYEVENKFWRKPRGAKCNKKTDLDKWTIWLEQEKATEKQTRNKSLWRNPRQHHGHPRHLEQL
jgi:hypothetical protein